MYLYVRHLIPNALPMRVFTSALPVICIHSASESTSCKHEILVYMHYSSFYVARGAFMCAVELKVSKFYIVNSNISA